MEESEKKKTGYNLPTAILEAFEKIADKVGGKEKWQVVSAALLMLIEADEKSQNNYIRRVREADGPGGSFEDLVKGKRHR